FQCNGAILQTCDPAVGYVDTQTCGSPALCNAGSGICDSPSCTMGTYRCLGKDVQVCSDGANWATTLACASNQVCDPAGTGSCASPTQMSAGGSTTCARMSNGNAMCWGSGAYGQLGNKTTGSDSAVPVKVLVSDGSPLADVVYVAVGANHACALIS